VISMTPRELPVVILGLVAFAGLLGGIVILGCREIGCNPGLKFSILVLIIFVMGASQGIFLELWRSRRAAVSQAIGIAYVLLLGIVIYVSL
jgi:hypothetical protein